MAEYSEKEPKVVQTDVDAKDGQNKCPQCGATQISLNAKTGKLRCEFCRYEFKPEAIQGMQTDISKLQGEIIGSGATKIEEAQEIMTFKCNSCGAEVVIDTSESTQARCHWCRNMLSVNQQIPNGVIPDGVLPFKLTKAQAQEQIEQFVHKRKFFAHPKFKEEFTTNNIMGVYFPYMVVDINSHVHLSGKGEHLVRRYTRKSGDHQRTYYDADLYQVERDFDLTIEGLTIESSSERLQKQANQTNNVINSIMPFDIENCAKYNANYLKGYSSEKRDIQIEELKPIIEVQAKDIARFSANETLQYYDRGVCWNKEELEIKGRQWKTAYLPVWLYSYQQKKGDQSLLHYVAVNARTKETMGSVPIHMPKLFGISCLVELCGIAMMIAASDFDYNWLFLSLGVLFFGWMYMRYRNHHARHYHEKETKASRSNLKQEDRLIKRQTGLSNRVISGANHTKVNGQHMAESILEQFTNLP